MSTKQDKAAAEAISKHIDPKFLSGSGKVNVATINGKTAPEYDGVPKTPADYDQVRMEIQFKMTPQNCGRIKCAKQVPRQCDFSSILF